MKSLRVLAAFFLVLPAFWQNGNVPVTNPGVVVNAAKYDATAQAANIAATTLITPAANGKYAFHCQMVTTTAGSALGACQVTYTDVDSGVSKTLGCTSTNGTTSAGTTGPSTGQCDMFNASSGVAIQISTASYVGGAYAVHAVLQYLGN